VAKTLFTCRAQTEKEDGKMEDSVSESDHSDNHTEEETLPGVHAASQVAPSPRRKSPTNKSLKNSQQQKSHRKAPKAINGTTTTTRQRAFELGTFSDSSSESDEDVASMKRSLFGKPIGGSTLMCLPKLSEYTQYHEDAQKTVHKTVLMKNKPQLDRKKKANKTKENKTGPVKVNQKKKKAKKVIEEASDAASEREDSESQADNEIRAVRTERNPKLKNRRSVASTKVNTNAIQPTRKPSSAIKVSTSRRSNRSGDQSDSLSDSSPRSFASLRNASSKIIETMYANGDQEPEHDITINAGEKIKPNISFTSGGQKERLTRSSVKHNQTLNISVTKPMVVTEPQSSRKRHMESNDIATQAKRQKNIKVATQIEQRDSEHFSANNEVPDIVPQKEAAKSKHIRSKAVSKNVAKIAPNKEKLKKPSHQAKKRQLVTELARKTETVLNGEDDDDGLRRSKRTRIPTLNRLLGEEVVYVASPSGKLFRELLWQ